VSEVCEACQAPCEKLVEDLVLCLPCCRKLFWSGWEQDELTTFLAVLDDPATKQELMPCFNWWAKWCKANWKQRLLA
jgi:hypothetical protein